MRFKAHYIERKPIAGTVRGDYWRYDIFADSVNEATDIAKGMIRPGYMMGIVMQDNDYTPQL